MDQYEVVGSSVPGDCTGRSSQWLTFKLHEQVPSAPRENPRVILMLLLAFSTYTHKQEQIHHREYREYRLCMSPAHMSTRPRSRIAST